MRRLCPLFAAATLLTLGCDREQRVFREVPPGATASTAVQTTELQAGPKTVDPLADAYRENRWAVSQGQMYYTNFNCAGCHAPGGGGGNGPLLNDAAWIYGSDPENIFDTVIEGRPNGMPSFRGKIGNSQLWQLVAYVRTLGGLTPKDTWPMRADAMEEVGPEPDPAPRGDP